MSILDGVDMWIPLAIEQSFDGDTHLLGRLGKRSFVGMDMANVKVIDINRVPCLPCVGPGGLVNEHAGSICAQGWYMYYISKH